MANGRLLITGGSGLQTMQRVIARFGNCEISVYKSNLTRDIPGNPN